MLNAISDSMRQHLPKCPTQLVKAILPYAQLLYSKEEFHIFRYAKNEFFEYQIDGQFAKNVTEMDTSIPNGIINSVFSDNGERLKPLVEKCLSEIQNACKYLGQLGENAVAECWLEQIGRCQYIGSLNEITHEGWTEGRKFCESLTVAGSFDKVVQCFEPADQLENLPLLSQVCTWTPPEKVALSLTPLTPTDHVIFSAVAMGAALLAAQRFRKEGVLNKVAGVALSAISVGALVIMAKYSK